MTEATPKLDRILETALYVEDLERAARFYEDVMGLRQVFRSATLRAYDVGARNVLLLFARGASARTQTLHGGTIPPHDGSGPVHVCFGIAAEALAGWEAHFAGRGVAIEGRVDWPTGARSVYFRDPDGHNLELMTPGHWPAFR